MLNELKNKRKTIISIAKKHGAKNVRVFGSLARQENTMESDIDFLVDMEGSLLKRIALMHDLQDLLGRKVDVMTQKSLHWYIRDKVLDEAIPL